MKLRKVIWLAIVVLVGLPFSAAQGQASSRMAPGWHPSFEVATIKPSEPGSTRQRFGADGNRLHIWNQTLTTMVMFAYSVHKTQIGDGPAWRSSDHYDIDGIADAEGEPNLKQMQEMLQKLLADRFGLVLHHDKRDLTYYAIVIGKGGSKLAKAADPDAIPDQSGNGGKDGMEMKFTSNTLSDFALGMQFFLDRPVIDETRLQGRFDFRLKWMPDEVAAGADANAPPGMFTAIQEQLGLKLEPKKGAVDVLVIDHLERPSEN